MAASSAERRVQARIASNERWAQEDDRTAATATARANGPGSLDYWLRKVDPDGRLPHADAVAKAESAKRVFYDRLAQLGRQAKAAKAASRAPKRRTRTP